MKQPENAIIAFGHAIKNNPQHREALLRKGEAHISTRQLAEAKQCFETVLESAPEEPNSLCTLGELLRKTGEGEKALEFTKKVLKANPQTVVAHLVAARAEVSLKKYDEAEKRLSGMLKRHANSAIKAASAKLLGDVHEAKGDYETAFENYRVGQETSESHNRTRIDEAGVMSGFDRRLTMLDQVDVSGWGAIDDGLPNPVFLLGVPRTGITLVEHMLCGHPKVVTSNQRGFLADTVLSIGNHVELDKEYPECLTDLDDEAVKKLRKSYWNRVDQYIPDRGDRTLVDRTPMSIGDAMFIRRLFPAAPVVHMIRDPRDACLSCFSEVLDFNHVTVLFSQLERSARVYGKLAELGIKATEKLGMNELEVRYENLVEGFDEAKKIVNHMGLEWDAAQEDFVKVAWDRYILDLAGEAAFELSTESVGRWKKYESKLAGVTQLLAPLVSHYGY